MLPSMEKPSFFQQKGLNSSTTRLFERNKRIQTEQSNNHLDVSENSGTPKSSILIVFSIINHPFWGTPIFGNTHLNVQTAVTAVSWDIGVIGVIAVIATQLRATG